MARGASVGLPGARAAQQGGQQSYLTPQMAQLLSQQGVIPGQISGIDDQLAGVERRGDVPLPQSRQSPGGWTTAPHWTEALSHVAAKTQEGFERRGLQKTRDKKSQQLADYQRDLTLAQAEGEAKRQSELVQHRTDTLTAKTKRDKLLDERNRLDQEALELHRASQAAATKANREQIDERADRTDARLRGLEKTRIKDRRDDQVRRLGQEHAESVRIGSSIENLDEVLTPYLKKGGNIPGVGYFEGAQGWYGNLIRGGLDFMSDTNEAQDMNAKIRGVLNPILRADAGTAQTLTETRNKLTELGAGGDISEEVFVQNYPAIREAYNRDMERLRNTYDPAAVEMYSERFGKDPLLGLGELDVGDRAPSTLEGGGRGDVPRFTQDAEGNYTVQ